MTIKVTVAVVLTAFPCLPWVTRDKLGSICGTTPKEVKQVYTVTVMGVLLLFLLSVLHAVSQEVL
jgi:hypothetical protein